MLYAVAEIAVFMIGATVVGFLLGRMTKRGTPRLVSGEDSVELEEAQTAIRELESERASLKGQLIDAKERVRQLASEPTADETSEASNHMLEEQNQTLQKALEEAEAKADRLRATIADRDSRIAQITSGEEPAEAAEPAGYSSSAGTLADMRIFFDEGEEAEA